MQAPPLPSDLRRAVRAVWCLTLRWGGRVVRVATEPLVIVDTATGANIQFQSGLEEIPAVDDLLDRQGLSDAGASVPMTVYLDGLSIAEEIASGRRLDSARGELAEIHLDQRGQPIQAWSRRILHVVSGRLLLPVYAGADTPEARVSFSLEEIPLSSSSTVLDPTAVIDAVTWPEADDTAQGKPYPVVIGAPGPFRKADGTDGTTSGSPAYPVEFTGANVDTLLICDGDVTASQVTVYDGAGASETFTPYQDLDARGRLVTLLDISGAGTISRQSDTYWIGWTSGGGILNPTDTSTLTRLGDVLQWALLRLGEPVDLPAFAARRAGPLEAVEVATYLNDPEQTPLELVGELIRPFETVTIRRGPHGLYPQVRLLDQPDDAATAIVTEGPDFTPISEITTQTEPGDIRNAVTVRFAPRANGGSLKRSITCTPDPDVDDGAQFATEHAISSASRFGRIDGETLEIPWIYDEASAAYIASQMVQAQGFPYATASYRADWRYGWLEVGMRLRFTSERLHLSDVQVEVVGKAPRIGGYEFLLCFEDDPVRLGSKRAT